MFFEIKIKKNNPLLICNQIAAFMCEVIPLNSSESSEVSKFSVDWTCAQDSALINDNDTTRNWVLSSLPKEVPWYSTEFAGYNIPSAWANLTVNPDCVNSYNDSSWGANLRASMSSPLHPSFSANAYWQFIETNQSNFAYCRGVVSLQFFSSVILNSSLSSPFMFEGSVLVLENNVTLASSGAISLQSNQSINFLDCVSFSGALSIVLASSQSLNNSEQSLTPIRYNCFNSSSSFNSITVSTSDGSSTHKCVKSVEYGRNSLSVLISSECDEDSNNNNNNNNNNGGVDKGLVIGVVVGVVGGCLVLALVAAVVLAVVVYGVKRSKLSRSRGSVRV